MIKTIYDLEPTCKVYPNVGVCQVQITFRGKTYKGLAELSPEDKDFFSEKVGLNIALSRARINLLKDLKNQAKIVANTKYQMYQEAIEYGRKQPAEIDPTASFLKKVLKAQAHYHSLQYALKREKKYLAKYLENQDKMVERVKLYRARTK